jgi:hypothetical protein
LPKTNRNILHLLVYRSQTIDSIEICHEKAQKS